MSADCAVLTWAEHSKEGKAELKTAEEPSTMRTENYPSGTMEVSGKLNKGVHFSWRNKSESRPYNPEISLLTYWKQETLAWVHQETHTQDGYNCFVCWSKLLEMTQTCILRRIDKLCYIHRMEWYRVMKVMTALTWVNLTNLMLTKQTPGRLKISAV